MSGWVRRFRTKMHAIRATSRHSAMTAPTTPPINAALSDVCMTANVDEIVLVVSVVFVAAMVDVGLLVDDESVASDSDDDADDDDGAICGPACCVGVVVDSRIVVGVNNDIVDVGGGVGCGVKPIGGQVREEQLQIEGTPAQSRQFESEPNCNSL